MAPIQLLSLYDIHYYLNRPDISNSLQSASGVHFFDSGQYEAEGFRDIWGSSHDHQQQWSEDLYVESAKNVVRPGDILVSYDDRSLNLTNQIQQSLALFERVGVQNINRNLLLHPNGVSPDILAESITKDAPDIDIIGLTEKDIGFPWFLAASYIYQLRTKLDTILDHYLPIHIFGCFDPQTIPYLFFSGADIFDGLAWMRYYFRDGHAFYDKEFEYDTSPEILLEPAEVIRNLLAHNIEELERLRADLRYSVLARDPTRFGKCLEKLKAFEFAASSQRNASHRRSKLATGEKNGR